MKDIRDMGIGESFYLKETVVTISTRTGTPCEFDEERIDINDLIISELEKIKAEITACTQQEEGEVPACINYGIKLSTEIVEKHISELKCKNCMLRHEDDICFFAYECIKNNHNCFKLEWKGENNGNS